MSVHQVSLQTDFQRFQKLQKPQQAQEMMMRMLLMWLLLLLWRKSQLEKVQDCCLRGYWNRKQNKNRNHHWRNPGQ